MQLYAQTASSTPTIQNADRTQTPTDEAARRAELVAALERAQSEVRAGRKYVDELENQLSSKNSIIAAQTKRQTLSDQAIGNLKEEIFLLNEAIKKQKEIIALDKQEIDYLKAELKKTNAKLARSRAVNKYLIAGAVGLIIALFAK